MKKLGLLIFLSFALSCKVPARIYGDTDFLDYGTLYDIKNSIETKEIVYFNSSQYPTSRAKKRKIKRDSIVQQALINFTKNTIELIFNEVELEKSRNKFKYSIEVEHFYLNDDPTLFQKFVQINSLIPLFGELAKKVIKENPKPVEPEIIRDIPKEYNTICDFIDCAEPTFYYYPRTIERIQLLSFLASGMSFTFAFAAPNHIWQKYQVEVVLNLRFYDSDDQLLRSFNISSKIDQGDKKFHHKTGLFYKYRDNVLYKVILDFNEQLRNEILRNKESFSFSKKELIDNCY